jgi:hypothetical protein
VSITRKKTNNAHSGLPILPSATFFILANLVCSSSLFAGLTPCAGTYNLGNSGAGALVSPGGASAGCEQVDKEFNNFNYSTGGSSPEGGSSVPVTFAGTSPTTAIGATFGLSNTWSDGSTGGTTAANTTAVAAYSVAVDPASSLPSGQYYAITSLSLSVNSSITTPVGTSDTAILFEYFCAGGSADCTTGTLTDGINLAAPTAGYIKFVESGSGFSTSGAEVICFNNGASSCTPVGGNAVNFAASIYTAGFTSIIVASDISVATVSGTQVSVNNFTENYFETLDTPEPSTFILMGSALAGIAALRFRKRKQA